jgi:fluoride exporter
VNQVLWVAAGGALGAVLRHLCNGAAARLAPDFQVAGTLFVNIAGCGAMGLLMGWLLAREVSHENALYLFLGTGLLGGFTTFSAFSKDVAHLIQEGSLARAAVYAGGTTVLSIAAFMIALALTRRLMA